MKVLVVRDAFGDFAVGQMIRDPAEIAAVETAGQLHNCTPTDVDEAFFTPEPPDEAAPTAKPGKGKADETPAA